MRSNNVSYLVKKGVSSVWKNFVMSFASFSILLVSLLQVSVTVLFIMNVNIIMGNIEDTNQIAIFVEDKQNESTADHEKVVQHIQNVLESNPNLTDVKHISKEEAAEKYAQAITGEAGDLINMVPGGNPMPDTFMARVTDISTIRYTVSAIRSIEGVEKVNAPYDFANALVNIRKTFSFIIIAMLVVLVLVSVVVISNTIRTSVFARRNEISIMKYVGATNGFIKLPFFVEGCFVGILAGAASWGLTWFIYNSVFSLFTDNLTLWQMFGFFNLIPFDDVRWIMLAANCAVGAFLGAVGTTISMNRYLKV
ncbi:MAG: permease-like cell division protein FtsX [Oscillospiraceae bacterium]|nr:permease-like cell division protein FtsX [Oscillospiraceae bacterium]